jgi:hypothetical protein
MPGFEPELVAEADVHQMYATWSEKPLTAEQTESCGTSSVVTLTPAEIRLRGIAAARKPDNKGFACVSCHSPDLFDVAYMGFDEATISRRGLMHVNGDDVKDIFRYVHLLRKEHKLPDRDPKNTRPFQPGGVPLSCSNPVDCDHVFGLELIKRVPSLAEARISTLAKAREFRDQFHSLNAREMPIGIALNRWTEDEFRGPEHGRFNEWIPDISYLPNSAEDRNALYQLHDAYIANPSWKTLGSILAELDLRGTVPDATLRVNDILKEKFKSVLIGSHLLRLESAGEKFASMPHYINVFGTSPSNYNPFWSLGDHARVMDNNYGPDRDAMFAPSQVSKILAPHTRRTEITMLRLSWFWLGFLFVAYMRFKKVFAQAYGTGTSVRKDGKQSLASNISQWWNYYAGYNNIWPLDTKPPSEWRLPPIGEKRELFLRTHANMVRAMALLLKDDASTNGVENKDMVLESVKWMPLWIMKTIHGKDFNAGAGGLSGDAFSDWTLMNEMQVAIAGACEKRELNYKETTYPNRCPIR